MTRDKGLSVRPERQLQSRIQNARYALEQASARLNTLLTEEAKLKVRRTREQRDANVQARFYRWVSCSKDTNPGFYMKRHVVRWGGLDTICNASASHPDVWRGDTTKPECGECAIWATKNAGKMRQRKK